MSTPVDLQALFANLKPKTSSTPANALNSAPVQPDTNASHVSPMSFRSASSPSPSFQNRPIPLKPSESAGANNSTAQSLLGLLNFGQANSSRKAESDNAGELIHSAVEDDHAGRAPQRIPLMSASDLVASFMNPAASQFPRGNEVDASNVDGNSDEGGGGPKDQLRESASQEALLRLLNRSQSSHNKSQEADASESLRRDSSKFSVSHGFGPERTTTKSVSPAPVAHERQKSPIRLFGTPESRETTPFEAPKLDVDREPKSQKKENKPIYSYKNPFEALNSSRNQTPNPQTPQRFGTPTIKLEFSASQPDQVTGERDTRSTQSNMTRKILMPKIPGRISTSSARETVDNTSHNQQVGDDPSASPPLPQDPWQTEHAPEAEGNPGSQTAPDDAWVIEEENNMENSGHDIDQHVENATKEDLNETAEVWESAEDSPEKESSTREVPVYNFPIKPFVSITLHLGPTSTVGIRQEGVMEISRLKKEFDHDDRSLAAATSKYIAYALIKNGGIRIIRQDDGIDRQIFKNSHDRICHVAFCSTEVVSPPSDDQGVLGIGVSGSVYYATVSKEGNDLFDGNMLESESLIFPPFPNGDENTSHGPLKTRAKRSARHPEFFAIGRGQSIYLIWPATALSPRYGINTSNRRVDVEKFYKERALRITTGKAAKDFTFSEDDTVIASLDKPGKLRFWDIQPLIDEANATAAKVTPISVDTPLLTLSTAPTAEKPMSTSVMFLDKLRPYTKGGALRYILIGLRQNHTLQLWDIALGKAVQELHLPHERDTDGICSVNYHPNSGIITVGHPTRNSIYFIHLSAPRYSLAPMSQAAYIQRIAFKDPEVPKPESTACMSGIREISFAEKGLLRSVELLPIYKGADTSKASTEVQGLFELYVVHSKGVTCLNIAKEDLGWSPESKVLKPVNAVQEGLITLEDLRLGGFVEEPADTKSQSEEPQQPAKAPKKKSSSKGGRTVEDSQKAIESEVTAPDAPSTQPLTNGSASANILNDDNLMPKETKKSKKNKVSAPINTVAGDSNTAKSISCNVSPTKPVVVDDGPKPEVKSTSEVRSTHELMGSTNTLPKSLLTTTAGEPSSKADSVTIGISGDWLDKELKKVEQGVTAEFRKEFNNLYRNIQNDRNIQDSAAIARQEAVLRLVSATLSTNTERSLSGMISTQMQQVVVPAITGVTVQAVTSQMGEAMARVLHQLVPHELGSHLSASINTALQNPQVSRHIAELVAQKVATQIDSQVTDLLQKSIIPSFKNLAISAAEKAAADVENRIAAQFRQIEADRHGDTLKLDKLSQVLQGMAETMQAMSDSQVAFQGQILKDRRQSAHPLSASTQEGVRQLPTARASLSPGGPASVSSAQAKSKEEIEFEEINQLMNEGKYEEGSIKWLQSTQPVELFDNLFVRFTPDYLATDVSPLVAFSVAITVANSLSTNTFRRIEWIHAAFEAVDVRDHEISDLSEHAPALLTSLIQKLDGLYIQLEYNDRNDRLLPLILPIASKAREMRGALLGNGHRHV